MKNIQSFLAVVFSFICLNISHAQNSVINFDGIDDYVSLDVLAPTFANNCDFTIEFWMRHAGDSEIDVPPALFAVNNVYNDWNGFLILINSDGTLRLDDNTPGTNIQNTFNSTAIINDGNCHHIAYTTNGTDAALYIDGILQFSPTTNFIFSSNNKVSLGQEWDNYSPATPPPFESNFFNGDMDEIRIWNTERTLDEISGHMNNELIGNENGLVALYNCNQVTGNNSQGTQLINISSLDTELNGNLHNLALNGETSNFINNSCKTNNTTVEELTIYPNPSSVEIYIDIVTDENNAQIQIFDISGKLVLDYTLSYTRNRIVINIQNLKSGTYYLTYNNGLKITKQGKFIKVD